MAHKVELNVFALTKDLEKQLGHDLQWTDVADKSGISRQLWLRLRSDDPAVRTGGIEFRTLGKLLDFFEAEGMPVSVADLFTVTDD